MFEWTVLIAEHLSKRLSHPSTLIAMRAPISPQCLFTSPRDISYIGGISYGLSVLLQYSSLHEKMFVNLLLGTTS